MTPARPTLDTWIAAKIDSHPLSLSSIAHYQLSALNRTISLASSYSQFYANLLAPYSHLNSLSDLSALPFTTPHDIRLHPLRFLSLPPGDVKRIVTLNTSGSSAPPKRIFFSDSDQELTLDFFHHGMRTILFDHDIAGILFPAVRPGSVGNLLLSALARIPIPAFTLFEQYSLDHNILPLITRLNISSLIGPPSIISQLALDSLSSPPPKPSINSVLLSSDFVSDSCRDAIRNAWNCEIFEHYGITEAGLGFAVSCPAHMGYHIREADLFTEIVDPISSAVLPTGSFGEIVFSTLTRRAMPLIRYRTGDISRILPYPCSCGSILPLLDFIRNRHLPKGGDPFP